MYYSVRPSLLLLPLTTCDAHHIKVKQAIPYLRSNGRNDERTVRTNRGGHWGFALGDLAAHRVGGVRLHRALGVLRVGVRRAPETTHRHPG